MKKGFKTRIAAVMVCAFALCLALFGCGGGGGASDDAAAAFEGDWVLSGGTSDGTEIDQAGIEGMQEMGMNVYIQLKADGVASINLFGTAVEGTWQAKDATTADITIEGDTEEIKIENDELVLEADGDSLRFKKGEIPADSAATSTDSIAEAGEAAAAEADAAADMDAGTDAAPTNVGE